MLPDMLPEVVDDTEDFLLGMASGCSNETIFTKISIELVLLS